MPTASRSTRRSPTSATPFNAACNTPTPTGTAMSRARGPPAGGERRRRCAAGRPAHVRPDPATRPFWPTIARAGILDARGLKVSVSPWREPRIEVREASERLLFAPGGLRARALQPARRSRGAGDGMPAGGFAVGRQSRRLRTDRLAPASPAASAPADAAGEIAGRPRLGGARLVNGRVDFTTASCGPTTVPPERAERADRRASTPHRANGRRWS